MESCGVQMPQGQPAEALLAKAAGKAGWEPGTWWFLGEKWDDTPKAVSMWNQHIT